MSVTDYTREVLRQMQQELPFVWLYEFESFDSSGDAERFRCVNYREDVPFDGNIYQRWPITHGEIDQNATGELTRLNVSAALDRAGVMKEHFERTGGLIGLPARIHIVNVEELTNPTATIFFDFVVKGCQPTAASGVTFKLSTDNLYLRKIPKETYSRGGCRFQFTKAGCFYLPVAGATNAVGGGFDFCPRLLPACEERGADELARAVPVIHPENFGGFPSMLDEPVE